MNKLEPGWLAPDGTLYPCACFAHMDAADTIAAALGLNGELHGDIALYTHGWTHIGISQIGKKTWNIAWRTFLTEPQKNALRSYIEGEVLPPDPITLMRWESEVA